MSTIGHRINAVLASKHIRKTELAKMLSISDAAVSMICRDKTKPSSQTVKMISRELGVNETWLITGEGEMFMPATRAQEIAQITADMAFDNESFRNQLIQLVAQMDESQMEMLKDMAIKLGHIAKNSK